MTTERAEAGGACDDTGASSVGGGAWQVGVRNERRGWGERRGEGGRGASDAR